MRILLITHFFPPTHNAGTENYTLGLATALQSLGHEIQIICAEDWETGEAYWNGISDEFYQNVAVKRLHLNWKKAADPNRVLYQSKVVEEWMSQYLAQEPFDVVHVTSVYSLGIGIMRVAKDAGIPLVLSLMDFWFLCPSLQLLRHNGELCDGITTTLECQSCMLADWQVSRRLRSIGIPLEIQARMLAHFSQLPSFTKQPGVRGRLLNMKERKQWLQASIELPDLLLTHSTTVQEIFARHSQRRIELLRNGHDLTWINKYQGKTLSDKLRVGYIGQIIPVKGIHVLIAAFMKANAKQVAKLEIWGDIDKNLSENVEYLDRLGSLISADPWITLCGRFERDSLGEVLSEIDVLVVPSLWYENAPLVIQEAFAAKTPVIASNLGGMAEAVSHDVDGLLFEAGNVDDLTKQLRRFFESPGLREKLTTSIKAVKQVEQEAKELVAYYADLVQQRVQKKTKRGIQS